MPSNAELSCGIDFGTSNSAVAVASLGSPSLIPLEGRHSTLPSAVFFNGERRVVDFGRSAIDAYVSGDHGRFMRALKSLLGSSLINERLRIQNRSLSYLDIISLFLENLKTTAEREAGRSIDHVVLGRPVYFVDDNKEADDQAQVQLEEAARKVGFRNVEFQFEPIAAALKYEISVSSEETALIIDIGGGTSDFSIVRVSPERARQVIRKDDILANAGIHIGGTDFDRLLSLEKVMPRLGYKTESKQPGRLLPSWCFVDLATWQRINFLQDPKMMPMLRSIRYDAAEPHLFERLVSIVAHRDGHRLAGAVEEAKVALASQESAAIDFDVESERLQVSIDRAELDRVLEESIHRIQQVIQRTLQEAQLDASAIDAVFMTGGSVSIPALKRQMLAPFPSAKIVEDDLFESVAMGLALDASRKFG